MRFTRGIIAAKRLISSTVYTTTQSPLAIPAGATLLIGEVISHGGAGVIGSGGAGGGYARVTRTINGLTSIAPIFSIIGSSAVYINDPVLGPLALAYNAQGATPGYSSFGDEMYSGGLPSLIAGGGAAGPLGAGGNASGATPGSGSGEAAGNGGTSGNGANYGGGAGAGMIGGAGWARLTWFA